MYSNCRYTELDMIKELNFDVLHLFSHPLHHFQITVHLTKHSILKIFVAFVF